MFHLTLLSATLVGLAWCALLPSDELAGQVRLGPNGEGGLDSQIQIKPVSRLESILVDDDIVDSQVKPVINKRGLFLLDSENEGNSEKINYFPNYL